MASTVQYPGRRRARTTVLGITLIELIVVIAITGVIAASIASFIIGPIRGFDSQLRRAELVDAAESALRRMQRDIRGALPNSVRVDGTGTIIEILSTIDGGRYRAGPPGDTLLFNGSDTGFDVIGTLQNASAIDTVNHWVVINNQVASGNAFNAYDASGHNRVRLSNATTLLTASQHIVTTTALPGDAPGAPSARSPSQRFFIVDGPVTYLCNLGARTLTRYSGYAITPAQPVNPNAAPLLGNGALVASQVSACTFTYQPGTTQRAGTVTLDLTVNDTTANEQVRLLHQTHVYNVP